MDRKKPEEYDELNKFARNIGGDFYGRRKWIKSCCQKYLPINCFAEKAIMDDRIDEHLPTKSDMDRLLQDIRMIPGDAKLEWRYLYDETGSERCVELSDGEGFVAYMSEELFSRLGLNEKAIKKG